MKKIFIKATMLAVLFTVAAISVAAQVTGGAITGSVVDQNGAALSGATVVLKDRSRGTEFTAQTTDSGTYRFPNVPTGSYVMSFNAGGFSGTTREVIVSLNQTVTVDVALSVGGATAVVDVVAGGEAVVQSDTSQIGTSFKGRAAQDLPINGDANALATLAPNVIPPANGTAGSGGVSGGVRARGNTFNVDGVDNNDASVTGPSTAPIQDAVEEFTLLQNNFNAEFGAGAGGQFNTITKSGTNEYHGSLFSYIGSQKLNARTTDEDGTDKKFFKEARYGFTFGGPLHLPRFGEGGPRIWNAKNKLFFFFAYEKYYQTGETTSDSFIVPTAAGLNQIAALPGVSPTVINIFQQYVSLAPTGDILSGITPVDPAHSDPNDPLFEPIVPGVLGVNGIPFGEVFLPIPAFQEQKSYQFNVDHLPNDRNQFRYRYARSRYLAEQAGNGGFSFNNNVTYNTDLFSINWIRNFSSNVVNDLRLSYLRTIQNFPLVNEELADFPNITINDIGLAIGPDSNLPQSGFDNNYQLYDSITWVTGDHTIKFGGDVRRYIGGSDFLPRSRGDYEYSSLDILLQDLAPDVVNIKGIGSGAFISNNHRFFGFFQDDWKIRPNFTLNLGIRYEYQGLYRDAALQATAANADLPGVIEFVVPETDKNNWAPRVGFAWSPGWDNMVGRLLFGEQGESSIRANYSRSFFPNFSNFALISLPPTLQGELQQAGSPTNFLANGGAGTAPFVPDLAQRSLRNRAGSFILPQIVPYVDSFAFSYQRQIGQSMGLEVRYLHTRGKQMPVQVQLNSRPVPDSAMIIPTFLTAPTAAELAALPTIDQAIVGTPIIPTASVEGEDECLDAGVAFRGAYLAPRQLEAQGFCGALTGFPPIGESRYNGLAISVNRRFTNNIGFTAAYTFSKTRDNSLNELYTSDLNPRRAQDAGEYFGEGLDIENEWSDSVVDVPHRFVTSFAIDLPFFNNSSNAFLKGALGGWAVNGIFQIQSGQPVTVQSGRDSNRNGDAAGDQAIFNPDGDPNTSSGIVGLTLVNGVVTQVAVGGTPNGNVRAYLANDPTAGYISAGYFAAELANNGAGTAGRNTLRTNSWNKTDLVLIKNTRFGRDGRFNFQIGAEMFDVFNQRIRDINGLGSGNRPFVIAGNAAFNDYSTGSYIGRTVRMRAKFIF